MGSAVRKALTLALRCLAEVVLEDKALQPRARMEVAARLEGDIVRAVGIFLFALARCALFVLLFPRHSAERNAKLANQI